MTRKDAKETQPAHVHRWAMRGFSEEFCQAYYKGGLCNAIRISQEEYIRREEEWTNYSDLVMSSPAYMDHVEMRTLTKWGRTPTVVEREKINILQARIDEREKTNDYLPKPEFPDPYSPFSNYVITTNFPIEK